MRHIFVALMLLSLLAIVGCGEKTSLEDMTGDAVADAGSMKDGSEDLDKPVVSETALQNEDKKRMCDETYEGPTRKICYRMFGVKQVIGGSVQ